MHAINKDHTMYLRILELSRGDKRYKYLKLVETARHNGKIVQKTLLNFGNIEQWPREKLTEFVCQLNEFCQLTIGLGAEDADIHEAFDFGACFAIDAVWNELRLSETIRGHMNEHACEIDIVPPVKAMVFNRLLEPSSKLRVSEWIATQAIREVSPGKIPLHHYYRSLDYLMTHKESLEEDIFWTVNDIFSLDLSLVFYDLTSSYFEGDCCPIACRGYSRDHRPDCRQIEIGLLVNRDGIPIAHTVWDGNVKDQTTVPETIKAMEKRFNIKRCIFVGDNGMATSDNITLLREHNYEYIVGMRLLKDARALAVLNDPSVPDREHFTVLKDNLSVHEVMSPGEGFHTDERVIICYNPERARSTRERRDKKLRESRDYLHEIKTRPPKRGQQRRPEKITVMVERALRKQGTHQYYTWRCTEDGVFDYHENTAAIDKARLTDGICMLVTNSSTLPATEIARGYRTLSQVEQAFRDIKNVIRIRPIYHYNDLRVLGHVFICVLAYLIEQVMEKKLKQVQMPLSAHKALTMLTPIRMVRYTIMNKTLSKRTNITPEQEKIFNALGVSEIPLMPAL